MHKPPVDPISRTPLQSHEDGAVKWSPLSAEYLETHLPGYHVLEMIGRGGMGAVYKARQLKLDRLVAVKLMPPVTGSAGVEFTASFQNEARILARLSHASIVSVFDYGETSDGCHYYIMEHVEGTDVARLLQERNRLPPATVLTIASQVCAALQYAHQQGVTHRDIKPANVLLDLDGQVKVADFGLARAQGLAEKSALSTSNMTFGTPDYVAPEALTIGMAVDARADLYSLGVMLYNMLTGEVPRGVFRLPSEKLGTDLRFDAIIRKAMECSPADRYQNAAEMQRDFQAMLTQPRNVPLTTLPSTGRGYVSSQNASSVRTLPRKTAHSGDATLWVTSLLGLALLAAGAWYFLPGNAPKEDASTPSPAIPAPLSPPPAPAPTPVAIVQPTAPKGVTAASAPVFPTAALQTIDLLPLVKVERDRMTPLLLGRDNMWRNESGLLSYISDGKAGRIIAPVTIEAQIYEIVVEFQRSTQSRHGFQVELPTERGHAVALILGYDSELMLAGMEGPHWPEHQRQSGLVQIRVQRGKDSALDHVEVLLNSQRIMDWKGKLSDYQRKVIDHPEFRGAALTSLYCRFDSYEFRQWTLKTYQGSAHELAR
jgi:serine/threonine protein kinase